MSNVLLKMAGHRKATSRYCNECLMFHTTRRAVVGAERCPYIKSLADGTKVLEFPAVVGLVPRTASK